MNRTLPCVLLALALSACGGGGGGGGSSSPANVNPGTGNNNGGGTQQPDLQTGVFTDAPVAGLRYRQGAQQGVTNAEGQFTYDTNSSEKVEFLIGNTSIGFATGAAAVTPFDLQSGPGSLNYHRGINVSRLLVSLDVDSNPANGIEMPADIAGFAGSLPFDLEPSAFEQDPQLNRLLPLFNVTQLVSEADVLDHLADNDIVVTKLDDARSRLDALGNVTVRWNPDLDSAGVLADIEAANGERLIILLGDAGGLYVDSVLYFDAAGRYALLNYSSDGESFSSNINGSIVQTFAVNNFGGWVEAGLLNDPNNYIPPVNRVVIDIASNTVSIADEYGAVRSGVSAALTDIIEAGVAEREVMELAAMLMEQVKSAMCNSSQGCSENSSLSYGLQIALADTAYADQRFNLSAADVDVLNVADICLASSVFNDAGVCGNGVALAFFISRSRSDVHVAVSQWEANRVNPWGSVILNNHFRMTSSEGTLRRLPSGIPVGSPDAPVPWVEGEAAVDIAAKIIQLNERFFYAELKVLAIRTPLMMRDCAYLDDDDDGTLTEHCGAYTALINSSQRQAVLDAFMEMVNVYANVNYLTGQIQSDRAGEYFYAPLDYLQDDTLRRFIREASPEELDEFMDENVGPVARKIYSELDRYYWGPYIDRADSPIPAGLSGGFIHDLHISSGLQRVRFTNRGVLIDPRFDSGYARVWFGYQ